MAIPWMSALKHINLETVHGQHVERLNRRFAVGALTAEISCQASQKMWPTASAIYWTLPIDLLVLLFAKHGRTWPWPRLDQLYVSPNQSSSVNLLKSGLQQQRTAVNLQWIIWCLSLICMDTAGKLPWWTHQVSRLGWKLWCWVRCVISSTAPSCIFQGRQTKGRCQ